MQSPIPVEKKNKLILAGEESFREQSSACVILANDKSTCFRVKLAVMVQFTKTKAGEKSQTD